MMATDIDFSSGSAMWVDLSISKLTEGQLYVVRMRTIVLSSFSLIKEPGLCIYLQAMQTLAKTSKSLTKISLSSSCISRSVGVETAKVNTPCKAKFNIA